MLLRSFEKFQNYYCKALAEEMVLDPLKILLYSNKYLSTKWKIKLFKKPILKNISAPCVQPISTNKSCPGNREVHA